MPKKRILIVDDEYVSLTKLNMLLEQYGECETATSGEQALELFALAAEDNEPFDLITLDISMNGQSGIETLKIIREIETKGSHVEVIMITGMTDAQNIRDSFKCGCTKLMTKPLVTQELHEAMKAMRWSKL